MIQNFKDLKIGIIGLGYVGLPLALEFAKYRKVIGYDINNKRIDELKSGIDINLESTAKELNDAKNLSYTNSIEDLKKLNCYILTVSTPINEFKKPDLEPLLNASKIIGEVIKSGDLIIYESTVYPGCIEEDCVPILEKYSNLKFNVNFFCGYSPERINPGDKFHRVSNIKKITSGSTPDIANLVDDLYNEIVEVGTHRAPSIKVAEAAKVIENTQRDINIAFINELSILFSMMNINTKDVLDAAETKWNFLNFKPGSVGGHCIGVDPYYLTHKAESIGYKPEIILAGRNINDNMGKFVASQFINQLIYKKIKINSAKILIMGLTFKENISDIRNSGIKSVIDELKKFNIDLDLYDPWVSNKDIKKIYNIDPNIELKQDTYDGIIISVAHDKFKEMGFMAISKLCKRDNIIFDLKYLFPENKTTFRL